MNVPDPAIPHFIDINQVAWNVKRSDGQRSITAKYVNFFKVTYFLTYIYIIIRKILPSATGVPRVGITHRVIINQ
jgi:hypothetical protein